MDMPWPAGLILLLLGTRLAHTEPLYILVTPRALRVGSPETIHVQAHSDSWQSLKGTLEVNLTVWDFPMKKAEVAKSHLLLSEANNFMKQASVMIPESLIYPPQPGQQHVIIRATWAPASTTSFMERIVPVAPHAGYIFIQTDKPLYTPEHLVQYRVFVVDHKMDPVTRIITLDIKNPEGITVISQNLLAKDGFFAKSFKLPQIVSFGTWSIEASYQSAAKQKFKAAFEVRDYVLPSFEVQLKPNKTFFHLNDEALGVDIRAWYVFKEPVDGHALAIFGVKLHSHRMPIQSSLQKVEISEGLGHVSLQKDTLMSTFEGPEEDFIGASIFVNVTVFSSGGEMVQAETSGVKIVRSPYNIKFIRTPQYFKPGMPFRIKVFVSNPDGSPASKVLVRCQDKRDRTSASGVATLTINTNANNQEKLPILVETDEPLQPEEQASANMTAWPYSTQDGSGNFLYIEVKTAAEVGSSIYLSLVTEHQNSETKKQITHFTILVLSKGRIVHAKHQLKSDHTVATIDVTSEMLPSFRILAFYLLPRGTGQDPELVADSIWVDVNDRCMETLKVGLKKERPFQTLKPNSNVEVKVTGDEEATVGLVAVDKAVYVLNSKHKLTQKKVWDVVEEHDIGCTAGSGKDGLAVFKDAGLDLKMSTGMHTLTSSDWQCPQSPPATRHRRSLKRLETKRNAVNKFETELERKCCEAGLRESPVGLSCEDRTRHVRHGPTCVAAFLSCCRLSEALTQEAREEQLLLGTSDEDEDLSDIFLEDQPIRTLFPESWLWMTFKLPKSTSGGISHCSASVNVPDSITTWQLVAVSLKPGKGLCISDPFELTVTKSLFVDLKLPSSVVRNEQVQIQAVLYNFRTERVKVHVELPYKEPLCSASKPGAPSRRVVIVPPTSSKMVPFVLLPLEIGKVDVEVRIWTIEVEDHIRKTLLVKAGGEIQHISRSILLNPQGQTQTEVVPRQNFFNMVPNTEAEVFVSVQGDILGETILGTLTPGERWQLLRVPTGCPEQTLSKLAPVVILTRYLDTAGQWGQVGVELREQVIQNIIRGYTHMLTHRSAHGTYHISSGHPGSTWLTSYVFRVFAQAYSVMTTSSLDLRSLCATANWIVTERQAEDGHFLENGPVIMASMQGGYRGSEADISLTALVLIALNEGKDLCSREIPNLPASMERARSFLEERLPKINTTFAVAIVSYALALTNSPRANDRLDSFASHDKTHWPNNNLDKNSLYTVEATAYALMQKVVLGRHNETHAIAKWLLEKRELGGGFKSTQTTVVALEALTLFREVVPFDGVQDLRVQISVPKKALDLEWIIDQSNAYQLRSAKFSAQDELEIKASGSGRGTISILTMYHRSPESKEGTCKLYHLNVTLHSTLKDDKKGEETFLLRMETRFQGNREATMSIIEVSLLTGFYPNQNDLKQLTSDMEMYAFQYETKMNATDSTVVLYLEKLSHKEDTVLGFRIHRMLQVEFLQAAQVTIYDYYEPSQRCSSFYNLPTESSSLRKICHKDVCRCAEEQCPSLRKDSTRLRQEELQAAACETGMDFAYKVKLESVQSSTSSPYIYYNMKLKDIIKRGTDSAVSLTRKKFIAHATCHNSLGLQEQETYLIMGHSSDLWRVQSNYIYVLGKKTFLMQWPTDGDVSKNIQLDQLERFSEYMSTHGCES